MEQPRQFYIGKYRVVEELGRGKNTVVYKAWQENLRRFVALKVLRKPSDEALQRFQEEMRFVAHLNHPSARRVYEVARSSEGYIYAAMEYVDHSLRQLIREYKRKKKTFERQDVIGYLKPIADVLDYIHKLGWVHLDVKPENILIFNDGRAILADFSIARPKGTKTHDCTPLYASPEQAAGDRPVGPWSDIYSLGVVAYEMLAGRPPFISELEIAVLQKHLAEKPPPLRRFNRKISPALERTIMRALEKNPSHRYRRASDFIRALEHKETPIDSMVVVITSVTESIPRPLTYVALTGLLMVSLGLAGWQLLRNQRKPPNIPTSLPITYTPSPLTPPPVVTLSPTPSSIPSPTATLAPTFTPTPTSTPSPTASSTPTFVITPEKTVVPKTRSIK